MLLTRSTHYPSPHSPTPAKLFPPDLGNESTIFLKYCLIPKHTFQTVKESGCIMELPWLQPAAKCWVTQTHQDAVMLKDSQTVDSFNHSRREDRTVCVSPSPEKLTKLGFEANIFLIAATFNLTMARLFVFPLTNINLTILSSLW